jgi:hypothetical protein
VASDGVRSSFSSVPCRQRTITPRVKAATITVTTAVYQGLSQCQTLY